MQKLGILTILMLVATVSISAMSYGTTVQAICNVSAQLVVPATGQDMPLKVFIRAGTRPWQPAEYQLDGERIVFHLKPGELGGSEIMLLINPPPGLNIDDDNPPALTGLKVDGKPLKAEAHVHLGASNKAPGTILIGVADEDNALDLTSVRAHFDGTRMAEGAVTVDSSDPRKATIKLDMGNIEYGSHKAVISMADASPQANEVKVVVAFDHVDMTNVLLKSVADIKMRTDSAFAGYEMLDALNDGIKRVPGAHCRNDVSWASAEVPGEHWLEVTLPQPKKLKEVTIYWASYGGSDHTSQKLAVQVPAESGWRTIAQSPEDGHPPHESTTLRFAPLEVSKFRVLQANHGGPTSRPDIMWVVEIEAR